MEDKKIINLLDNAPNQPSKFRTKNWVELNDESRVTYPIDSHIKFKTIMLKSSLCNYGHPFLLVKGRTTVNNTGTAAAPTNSNKKVIFKNCTQFTDCIFEIKNTQVANAKQIDIVMPMHNLIEYSNNYSKTSGCLWQNYKDIPAVDDGCGIVGFNGANATYSFNFKTKITGQTDNNGEINNVEIMVPLKYLGNFWRTLEILLNNCEVNLILTWSANCTIIYTDTADQIPTFTITETKLYNSVVTLSTQDNAKLLPQLKPGFKRRINWNKHMAGINIGWNPDLNHLVEQSFQGVNRLFVQAFENGVQRTSNRRYYLPNVEIKDHNVMTNVKNFFDQPVKNKMANLDTAGNTRIYFILEEAKETVLDFSQGTVNVLQNAIE